jgi:hypothetical protein
MEYGHTSHNTPVYASPLLGNDGQRHRRDAMHGVSTMNPPPTTNEMSKNKQNTQSTIVTDGNPVPAG